MKKVFFWSLVSAVFLIHGTDQKIIDTKDLVLIDKVIAVIDGPEQRHIICQSELERVGIDGRKPTLNDLITEELIYQDALRHKIPIDDYADRYIRSIKKMHNIGDKEVNNIFAGAGLSPEEGRFKLQKMGANATMVDVKVKSRIFIPQSDVEKIYNENPLYKEPRYQLQAAFIPYFSKDSKKQEEQLSFIEHQCANNDLDVAWGDPFWIKEEDLADNKKFITLLKKNEISKPQLVENGFELYRLQDKTERRLVPLEKRYRKIVDQLREPKFEQVFSEYMQELYKIASIVYVDKSYEPKA